MSLRRASQLHSGARRLLATGSHNDFARVVKTPPSMPVQDRIKTHLSESNVVLYMKGLPSNPMCGFSWRTVRILNAMGVEYRAHNVLGDDALRQGIKDFSEWPTIPQVYIKGEFIGGSDILETMAKSGDLKKMLLDKGILNADQDKSTGNE